MTDQGVWCHCEPKAKQSWFYIRRSRLTLFDTTLLERGQRPLFLLRRGESTPFDTTPKSITARLLRQYSSLRSSQWRIRDRCHRIFAVITSRRRGRQKSWSLKPLDGATVAIKGRSAKTDNNRKLTWRACRKISLISGFQKTEQCIWTTIGNKLPTVFMGGIWITSVSKVTKCPQYFYL